ncbi:MAG: molybdopterin-dependent oxidoreductase [Candidatus Eisenbacteria bacterium]|nr:molybdopterin-dependent oxidoreductase [Candidatus Eisenbacteria bacterium]
MKDEQEFELDLTEETSVSQMSRRQFLKITGGGIFLFFTIGDLTALAQQRQGFRLPTDFNAFLKIGEDGRVSCYTGKIEMGQGVFTSLAQELADELDVSLDVVDMVMGDTDLCPWDMGTFGSMTTPYFGPALRAAGAEARQVLVEIASEQLKVSADNLTTQNGVIFDKTNRQNQISYAELAKGKKIERHLPGVPKKKPSEFRIMSKPALRRDAREKVTGEAKYAGDIQLPGMLYARILRPPAHGAKLVDVDLSEVNQVKDVQIVREGDFIAVLHKHPDSAEIALSKMRAKFDVPQSNLDERNIFEHLLKVAPEGTVVAKDGNLQAGESGSRAVIEETYLNDYIAHAPIEPHTAVVSIEGNKATVWPSSQTPFSVKEEVAKELGFPSANVRVISPFVGGAFGGKTRNLQAVEAARLARLSGKPVQVAWSRKEEFFYDSFRPAAIVKIRSGIAGGGSISFWDYYVYFAGERGSKQFYAIPNHSTVAHNPSWTDAPGSHPFATGPWRAPANNTNTFARESQIDIMAAKAGVDPLEFRLQNLTDKKMQRVLQTAAEKFGWMPGRAPSGRGCGIACGIDAGTYVATIAEVGVDRTTGGVRVKRVVCAQDMGLAINPEGAALQMEGCIMMGLGYALTEQIHFKNGEVLDLNFDSYEIPRFSWLPKIETVIIDNKDFDSQGGGEPAIITMGGVLANAIYDAVGVRLFQLPMTPARVKEAVKKG